MLQKFDLNQFSSANIQQFQFETEEDVLGQQVHSAGLAITSDEKKYFTALISNFLSVFTDRRSITPKNLKPIDNDKKTKASIQTTKEGVSYLLFVPKYIEKFQKLLKLDAVKNVFEQQVSIFQEGDNTLYVLKLADKKIDGESPLLNFLKCMASFATAMDNSQLYHDAETLWKPLKKFINSANWSEVQEPMSQMVPEIQAPKLEYQTSVEKRDDDVLQIIKSGNGIVRGVGSTLNGWEKHWKFEAGDLQKPWHAYYRTPNPKEDISYDRSIKINVHKSSYTLGTGATFDYENPENYIQKDPISHKRGKELDKSHEWTKKRSASLLPKNGRIEHFKNDNFSYDVALLYDRRDCQEVSAYAEDVYLYHQWKYPVRVDGSIDLESTKKHLPRWRPSADVLLQEMNQKCDQYPKALLKYPELQFLFRKKALVGLYLFNDDRATKYTAIQKKLYLRRFLGLDLPMVLLGDPNPVLYTVEQQKTDVIAYIQALSTADIWLNDLNEYALYAYALEIGCDIGELSLNEIDQAKLQEWIKENPIDFHENTRSTAASLAENSLEGSSANRNSNKVSISTTTTTTTTTMMTTTAPVTITARADDRSTGNEATTTPHITTTTTTTNTVPLTTTATNGNPALGKEVQAIVNEINVEIEILEKSSNISLNVGFELEQAVKDASANPTEDNLKALLNYAENLDGQPSIFKKLGGLLLMLVGVLAVAAGIVLSVGATAATFGLAAPLTVPVGAAIASSGAVLAAGGAFLFFNGCRKGLSKKLFSFVDKMDAALKAKQVLDGKSLKPNSGMLSYVNKRDLQNI